MGISAKVTGTGGLFAKLDDAKRIVRETSREVTKDLNHEIMEGSKARAPFDTGALEESHREVVEDEADRIRTYVMVGPVYHGDFDYSEAMHEGIVEGYPYSLGPGSLAKNSGTPHYGDGVGWKFLQRAFDAVMRVAQKRINDRLKAAVAAVKS
jgi:hypothetical protein